MNNKEKIRLLLSVTLLVSLLLQSCSVSKTANTEKPNVILIITDDQGYGDMGCHGNPFIQTPHMDALHKESFRLTNFHVSPTCAPTRSALLTGRYGNRTGVWHTIGGWSLLRENEQTMGDMFAQAGYRTGAFGKWHLGDNHPYRPFERGFQETVMHGGGGVQQTPDYWDNDYFDDTYFKNGVPQKYSGYCTDVFFDEAIQFIENNQQKPFFCYIATNAPHWPYNVPVSYIQQYEQYEEDQLLPIQKRFLGMITNIDDNLGRLRQTLTDLEIADNTLLIYMTDNGTAAGYRTRENKTYGFNAGMRGTKASKYDGGHRVPFFIYWKDGAIHGGKDIAELSAHIDVLPTLAELCAIPLPNNHLPIDGKSLVPLLRGKTDSWKERILITDSQRIQKPEKWRRSSVMSNRWRLIDGQELYDMENDPGQQQDVAAQFPEQVNLLRKEYEAWWLSTSTDFDSEPAIKIGTEYENPVSLTAHDWHAENGNQPWNQLHIRRGYKGKAGNGYWTIEVTEPGTFEINLSRYPPESGLELQEAIPGISMSELPGLDADIPAGKSLKFNGAWLKIGEQTWQQESIAEKAVSVQFTVELPQGKSTLSAAFIDQNQEEFGAYYVSCRYLK